MNDPGKMRNALASRWMVVVFEFRLLTSKPKLESTCSHLLYNKKRKRRHDLYIVRDNRLISIKISSESFVST